MQPFFPERDRERGAAAPAGEPGRAAHSALLLQTLDAGLVLSGRGRVVPWIGLALRGVVAARWKANVCRHDPEERLRLWTRCEGCEHQLECSYARAYEPRAGAAAAGTFTGFRDGARAFVLAPLELLDAPPWPRVPLRLAWIGEGEAPFEHALSALRAAAGAEGLGPDRLAFALDESELRRASSALDPAELPPHPDAAPERLSAVTLFLRTPLFLRERDASGRRRDLLHPELGHLLRASLRVAGTFFRMQGAPLAADFAALKRAADAVPPAESSWRTLRQPHASSRSGERFELRGVTGWARFCDVPAALLPWLIWGGRLHAGNLRVAGAGAWDVAAS